MVNVASNNNNVSLATIVKNLISQVPNSIQGESHKQRQSESFFFVVLLSMQRQPML